MQKIELIHEPFDDYLKASTKYLTSHMMMLYEDDPLKYVNKLEDIKNGKEEEVAIEANWMLFGRAAHTYILEGKEAFDREFTADAPINPRTGLPFGRKTKAYSEWACGQDLTPIDKKSFKLIRFLKKRVDEHPTASELLSRGEAEGVIRCDYPGVGHPCQCRIDWFRENEDGSVDVVDLKTTHSMDNIKDHVFAFRYDRQLAFYRSLINAIAPGREVRCHIIAVEKAEPHRVHVLHFSKNTLDLAEDLNFVAVRRIAESHQRGDFRSKFDEDSEV